MKRVQFFIVSYCLKVYCHVIEKTATHYPAQGDSLQFDLVFQAILGVFGNKEVCVGSSWRCLVFVGKFRTANTYSLRATKERAY